MAATLGVVILLVVIAYFVCLWLMFERAGKPGWAALVPIYNVVVMCRIGGRSAWWAVPMLFCTSFDAAQYTAHPAAPLVTLLSVCVGVGVYIWVMVGIARSFGRGTLFGWGLTFLPPVFMPILVLRDPD